jgi:hypothetical protein
MIWKESYYPGETEEYHGNLSQHSRCSRRDSNQLCRLTQIARYLRLQRDTHSIEPCLAPTRPGRAGRSVMLSTHIREVLASNLDLEGAPVE